MTTRRRLVLVCCLVLSSSSPALAQLAPPNDIGVALGHIHLVVKNVETQKEFWTTMLGGTAVTERTAHADPVSRDLHHASAGRCHGSVGRIDRQPFRIRVQGSRRCARPLEGGGRQVRRRRDESESGIRLRSRQRDSRRGLWRSVAARAGRAWITSTCIRPKSDIPAMQAWYAKVFGGLPGKRQRVALPGLTDCDYFHRFNLSFSAGEGKLAPTKGRELDHIGFDVRNLDDFEKRLGVTRLEVRGAAAAGAEYPDESRVPDRSVGNLHRSHRAPCSVRPGHARLRPRSTTRTERR